MLPDEKNIRADNLQSLKDAQRMLMQRSESEHSCFESLLCLNKAALTMLIAPDVDEDDVAALCEVLLIQDALIRAAYAHYRLRTDPVTTKQS